MWEILKIVGNVKQVVATAWSESMAWTICKENNSISQYARGIKYDYRRAV